jgi:hypothetical protein
VKVVAMLRLWLGLCRGYGCVDVVGWEANESQSGPKVRMMLFFT